jgi:Transcriptional regulator, contains sigma factor-related N-terminal domain
MTKAELGEYIRLGDEIKLLEGKIKELEQPGSLISTDIVKGSSKSFPYTEHPIKIIGLDEEYADQIEASIRRKSVRLKNMKLQREEEAERIFDFINSQKDSRRRQILTYAYIDGKKQREIAKIMHIDRSLVSLEISKALK